MTNDDNNSIDWSVEFERVTRRLEQSKLELEDQRKRLSMERTHQQQERVAQARAGALNSLNELREKMDKPSPAERVWSKVKEGSQFRNPVKAYWRMLQIAFGRKADGE